MLEAYSETNYASRHLISNRIEGFATVPLMAEDVQRLVYDVRKILGLTQEGLAAKIGVVQSTVQKWESGEHSPNLDQWRQFIDFAKQNPETRHLVESVNDVVAHLEPDDQEEALDALRAWVAARLAKKKRIRQRR